MSKVYTDNGLFENQRIDMPAIRTLTGNQANIVLTAAEKEAGVFAWAGNGSGTNVNLRGIQWDGVVDGQTLRLLNVSDNTSADLRIQNSIGNAGNQLARQGTIVLDYGEGFMLFYYNGVWRCAHL